MNAKALDRANLTPEARARASAFLRSGPNRYFDRWHEHGRFHVEFFELVPYLRGWRSLAYGQGTTVDDACRTALGMSVEAMRSCPQGCACTTPGAK